ncbi:MAG: hypothetical protein B6I32_05335, partial [Desulfobacterium sp. 4572_20]
QMGTRFIATHESIAPLDIKKRILYASSEDTVVTTLRTGSPTRTLRTAFTEKWEELIKSGASVDEIKDFRRKVLKRTRGNIEEDTVGAGQVCGLIRELKSVRQIIECIIKDASTIYMGLKENGKALE